MISLIRRIVNQSLIFRQRLFKTKLDIGRVEGETNKGRFYNTKNRSQIANPSNQSNRLASNNNAINKDLLQFIIRSVAGTVREVFITNVLRRGGNANWASQIFKYRPVYGLVGLGLTIGQNPLTQHEEFEQICAEIRRTLRNKNEESPLESPELETAPPLTNENESEDVIEFKDYLSKGQCGAVYEAKVKEEDVAVKVMFNFSLQSNATTILKGMMKELVPYKRTVAELDYGDVRRCGPHPNIVNIKDIKVSNNVPLPGAREHWPDALPTGLNGFGRNMTLYIVMEKYDSDLQTFLRTNPELLLRERILIFSQMLEGVAFLKRQGIAHRDLKCDNFLVKVLDYPHVVITDFGCCLASKKNPLQLAYSSDEVDIGGNKALLAPEIIKATPGTFKWLNYEKSDAWAVGAIAYEVFGYANPFYTDFTPSDYSVEQLPVLEKLPKGFGVLNEIIRGLLAENPNQRLSAELAAMICYILLWGPRNWWLNGKLQISDGKVIRWLMLLTAKAVGSTSEVSETNLMKTFLQRVNYRQVQEIVRFCHE